MHTTEHLKYAKLLAFVTDKRFKVFGFRFGIDPLLGLIPGFGDAVAFILSLYLIWIGHKMRLPQEAIIKMIKNVVFDFLIGTLPVIGDVADFFYRANSKNFDILKQYDKSDIKEATVVE